MVRSRNRHRPDWAGICLPDSPQVLREENRGKYSHLPWPGLQYCRETDRCFSILKFAFDEFFKYSPSVGMLAGRREYDLAHDIGFDVSGDLERGPLWSCPS